MNTPKEIQESIAKAARARRLELGWTQAALAERSGVSLGSLKRFERTGKISFESLLKLAVPLDAVSECAALFQAKEEAPASLEELLKTKKIRQRGRKK